MSARLVRFASAALLSAATLASAQAQSNSKLPPNVPPPGTIVSVSPTGVRVVTAPPAGFDPMTASPAAKAQYSIPPAPDSTIAPEAYREWQRAVAGPKKQVAPVLSQMNISNGPARIVGAAAPSTTTEKVRSVTSSNWSGTSIVNNKNPFKVEAIIAEFVVPTARQAFGACTGAWTYSSQWPGIDGNGSSDVLQAGVEVDAYCNGGTTASFYSAWVEWFPFNEIRVSSPSVSPGDLIFVEVWNTSPINGYVFFKNFSTQELVTYQLTAPLGTTLRGNSIEWIVERPSINNSLAVLTNYIDVPWPHGVAWNYSARKPTYYYQGKSPSSGSFYLMTMVDDGGNGISAATVESSDFLWFQDFGTACGVSPSPPC